MAVAACGTSTTERVRQELALNAIPARASCELTRDGNGTIAKVVAPAVVRLQRRDKPLKVKCSSPGYQTRTLEVAPRPVDYFKARLWETATLGVMQARRAEAFAYPDVTVVLAPLQ
jgi:hypothetical protein